MTARPPVSVIVPFAGDDDDLGRLLADLSQLTRREGDEVIVADNRPQPPHRHAGAEASHGRIDVVAAAGIRSPAFARNRGAAHATGEWLVFIDADTQPEALLLDAYFDPPPADDVAVMAGAIDDIAGRPTAVARHTAARRHLGQGSTLNRVRGPYAQSANCAVRRHAFAQVGGFDARARAGEDADLCYRLLAAGWRLEERPGARVAHRSRETLPGLVTQLARHGSGAAWLNDRYPGTFPTPSPHELAKRLGRSATDAVTALAHRDPEAARARLLDLLAASAFELGRLLPNRARLH